MKYDNTHKTGCNAAIHFLEYWYVIDVFSGLDGRYVKVTLTGAESYTGSWVSLSEFRIFSTSFLGIEVLLQGKCCCGQTQL